MRAKLLFAAALGALSLLPIATKPADAG